MCRPPTGPEGFNEITFVLPTAAVFPVQQVQPLKVPSSKSIFGGQVCPVALLENTVRIKAMRSTVETELNTLFNKRKKEKIFTLRIMFLKVTLKSVFIKRELGNKGPSI